MNRRKWVQEMWWTQQVRAACKSAVSKWLVYQHWHSFPIIRTVFLVLVLLILNQKVNFTIAFTLNWMSEFI